MLAVSSLSGLGLPGWAVAACAAVAVAAGAALVRHERRVAAPLLDLRALAAAGAGPRSAARSAPTWSCSARWCCSRRWSPPAAAARRAAGLLLTALPAGFGLAAVARRPAAAGRLAEPAPLRRSAARSRPAAAAALAVPAPDAVVTVALLGLLGVGLGIYTPANNAEIMAAVPARDAAAAGGMVNMTRGIGTALGVAVVTLGLHAGALPAVAGRRPRAVDGGARGRRAGRRSGAGCAGAGRDPMPGSGAGDRRRAAARSRTAWPRGSPGCVARCAAAPASPIPATPSRWLSLSCSRR